MSILNKDQYVKHCWKAARDYCEGVKNGPIVCNENIRLAVLRHERNLERSDLEWKPEAVEKEFKFFSYLYVDKHKQFILQPFQTLLSWLCLEVVKIRQMILHLRN